MRRCRRRPDSPSSPSCRRNRRCRDHRGKAARPPSASLSHERKGLAGRCQYPVLVALAAALGSMAERQNSTQAGRSAGPSERLNPTQRGHSLPATRRTALLRSGPLRQPRGLAGSIASRPSMPVEPVGNRESPRSAEPLRYARDQSVCPREKELKKRRRVGLG
jgi:hypothetical protein